MIKILFILFIFIFLIVGVLADCYLADINCDGNINITELNVFINDWKSNQDISLLQVLETISIWKTGNHGETNQDIYYEDLDLDGYGSTSITYTGSSPPWNYASRPGDCNDNNYSIAPIFEEICDGIDQDCDNQIDEGIICTATSNHNITVDFSVEKGTVPEYYRYMNHVENVKGNTDHQRMIELGHTIERAYWMPRFWAEGAENGPVYNWNNQPGPYGNDPHFDDVVANGGEILLSIAGNSASKALPTWLQTTDHPDFPNDLDAFQRIIEDGLRHLKTKYPYNFIYFESQNEPGGEIDVTTDEFKLMHERIQLAVNTVNAELPVGVPKIKVIAPTIHKWNQPIYLGMSVIYGYLKNQGLTLDYGSYHLYGSNPMKDRITVNEFYNAMREIGFNSPIFITEIGYTAANLDAAGYPVCNASNPDPTNVELSTSAVYIMNSYMSYMDSGKNVIPVLFSLHDYVNNIRSVLVFRCVDSTPGKVNPLYNALMMWSELNGTRVQAVTTDGNIQLKGVRGVAVKDEKELKVLVINNNPSSKNVKVIFNNIPSEFLGKTVTYKRYLVDRTHNNYGFDSNADLMDWNQPYESGLMTLTEGEEINFSLDISGITLLVFETD